MENKTFSVGDKVQVASNANAWPNAIGIVSAVTKMGSVNVRFEATNISAHGRAYAAEPKFWGFPPDLLTKIK
jgi:hypothetical protein